MTVKKTLNLPKFDATLNTDACDSRNNAELTLKLKLGFRQINPAAGATSGMYNDYGDPTATARKIVKWTPGEWAAWKSNFVRSAQAFWNGKFWLVNQLGYFGYKAGAQIYLPNIYCRFDLVGSEAASGVHHHVIDVVRPRTGLVRIQRSTTASTRARCRRVPIARATPLCNALTCMRSVTF